VTLDDRWQPSYFLCHRIRWRPTTTDYKSNIRVVSKKHSQILGNAATRSCPILKYLSVRFVYDTNIGIGTVMINAVSC
jgi:hypothetical protein